MAMSKEEKREYNRQYNLENKEKRREYFKQWRLNNKEKAREKNRQDYLKNRERYKAMGYTVYASLKSRAKREGIPFDIQLEDITPPAICPVLGVPLERGEGSPQRNSPSVDRIIPELGYVKGNVQVISQRANSMKNDATPEELALFAKWIQRTYPEYF